MSLVSRAPHDQTNKIRACRGSEGDSQASALHTMTGAHKDRDYRRNKRAESKRLGRHQRARTKKLGKMGPASDVRTISVEGAKKE